ncbi:hypothetical protein GCM10027341_40620 [Spirosoma knui]
MNPNESDDNLPFVREECGDTMWDETVLDALATPQADPIASIEPPRQTANSNESAVSHE